MRFHYDHDGAKRHWLYLPFGHELSLEFGRVPRMAWAEIEWGEMYCEGWKLSAGLWFGGWLTWRWPWFWRRWLGDRGGWPKNSREAGIKWVFGTARLSWFNDSWEGINRNNSVKLWDNDWLLGKNHHQHRILMPKQRHVIEVGWWDGDEYAVDVHLEERKWTNRVRTITQISYSFDVPKGMKAPPFPGKGENSWDCGDDGLYGAGVGIEQAADIGAALQHFAGIVIRNRLRYGNRSWRPSETV